ncbi:protein HIRA homolog [Musca vetustissima]|uniref:protein HIRA homolog n=1 Tax=Musca vetustissima TaxID=27455 RepID=UPI002AB6E2D3|nr:protein HIRA homolog [Musca vetustissima]
MKLLKPSWVHHDEKPIFSIDVHQECLKFATGGQGVDSGRVVIWNLLPVLSEKAELDESVPKMLCQMDNHLACVNCVRWSQNGLMLASCSDDKLVMIWKQLKGPSGVFGTGGIQKNPESWKCMFTLRGHAGDVLDLAWSPQDRWLASCSVDNTIIVWDAQNFPVIITTLRGHTGLVKGVSWDPVCKFLASQSDDRSVKIWKTCDWSCSNTITEPFQECGGTTHILRLSWSPDGQYLVSAHAINSGGPTAQIIEREGWKCDKDFVGHRKAVTCVRFHTAILKRQAPKSQKPQQYCCLAVGSRDRSLSVWMTALQRPLVVIHELFNDSILDLSWGPEKYILMACSGDGTVACLQFSENELGTPLSEEDRNALYQRIYGKTAANLTNGSTTSNDMLIENPELILYSQNKPKPPTLPTMQLTTNHNNINNNYIESTGTLPSSNGFGTPSDGRSVFSQNSTNSAGSVSVVPQTTPVKAISKQMETRTKDGKRRITPMFIPLNTDTVTGASDATHSFQSTSVLGGNQTTAFSMPAVQTTETKSTATTTTTITGVNIISNDVSKENIPQTAKSSSAASEDSGRLDPRLVKSNQKQPPEPFTVKQDSFKEFPHFKRTPQHIVPTKDTSKVYMASTAGPKITINASTKCEFQKTAMDYRVHVANGAVQTATGPLARVTAIRLVSGKLWETFVGSPIINFNFCLKCVMLCSLDGSLRLMDLMNGNPLMPVISLSTSAIQCAFSPKGTLVGVVTECGLLRIWNIEKCTCVLSTTCSDIFGKHGAIYQYTITENGVPLIVFSDGNSYSFSPQMQAWLVVSAKDPITRHGIKNSIPKEFPKDYQDFPLMSVQSSTNFFATTSAGIELFFFFFSSNANDWQSIAKIQFAENQIKLCEMIKSPEELKFWYSMLVFYVSTLGNEKKLRDLLNDLLGSGRPTAPGEEAKILDIPKHSILESTLEQIKLLPRWQRIYMEYNELYHDIKTLKREEEEVAESNSNSPSNNNETEILLTASSSSPTHKQSIQAPKLPPPSQSIFSVSSNHTTNEESIKLPTSASVTKIPNEDVNNKCSPEPQEQHMDIV